MQQDNRSLLWSLIVIVAIIAGGVLTYYAFVGAFRISDRSGADPAGITAEGGSPNPSGQAASATATKTARRPSETLIVRYTNAGWSPSTISIYTGDTVRFVNESKGRMWVASDPHPFHTTYRGFDQKASVPAGGYFEFLFTEPGTWNYHNHADPSFKGVIKVE